MFFKNIFYKIKRYILAIIGLAIGVASVISMGYLGAQAKFNLIKELERKGVDLVFVYPERAKFNLSHPEIIGEFKSLKKRDLYFIDNFLPYVYMAIPEKTFFSLVRIGDKVIDSVRISGTTKDFFKLFDYNIIAGNVSNFSKGAFIGYTIYKNFFQNKNPIGKYVEIKGKFIKIVGVLSEKGVDESGEDQDKIIVLPIELFNKKFDNLDYFNKIYVKPVKPSFNLIVKNNLNFLLSYLHKLFLYPQKQKDFVIKSMDFYLKKQLKMAGLLSLTTLIVSTISLLVGGIGVMAILIIMSIEETREIGIKRAFGATKFHIFFEFLIRALILGIIGAISGVIVGVIVAEVIKLNFHNNLSISLNFLLIGVISSIIISFIFGIFPAVKASKISPIEALSYE